jgi:NTP pyrophosphatase (non-canonical NTP hydrolase)
MSQQINKLARKHELLTVLMEECAEVIVECSKIIRFGESSVYEGKTALDNLEKELGDLQCMVDLLHNEDMISMNKLDEYADKKLQKLKKWSNLIDDGF